MKRVSWCIPVILALVIMAAWQSNAFAGDQVNIRFGPKDGDQVVYGVNEVPGLAVLTNGDNGNISLSNVTQGGLAGGVYNPITGYVCIFGYQTDSQCNRWPSETYRPGMYVLRAEIWRGGELTIREQRIEVTSQLVTLPTPTPRPPAPTAYPKPGSRSEVIQPRNPQTPRVYLPIIWS